MESVSFPEGATLIQNHDGGFHISRGRTTPEGPDIARVWYPFMDNAGYLPSVRAHEERIYKEQDSALLRALQSRVFPQGDKITLQGHLGAGKSAVAKILADSLGIETFSGGAFLRALAKKRNVNVTQMNTLANENSQDDIVADMKQVELGRGAHGVLVDGRVGPITVPHSLKVFMAVHPDVGAKRIYQEYVSKRNASRTAEAIYESVDDVLRANTERMEAEKARYLKTYGVDITDLRLYDAVIDTTYKTPQQVADILLGVVSDVRDGGRTARGNLSDTPLFF